MKLVIAEKPSVAQSLAAVLGAGKRGQGYLEGNGYLVSWCVGHLVGLAAADAYDPKYSRWCYEDLPIIPEKWRYAVAPDKKEQYEVLVSLMNRPDVESLVCATDAGREGELIFRLVYDHADCKKPFDRLWISSMEDSAIREGFAALRPGKDYDRLYEAALCRAKADWLVGISGTRLFSSLYQKTLNVGRVMTPTLALVVEREAAISGFKKEKFYTVALDCGKFSAVSGRCENRKAADHLAAACYGQAAVVNKVEKKQKSVQSPKLYDLTSLQRDGNRIFGYTAQQVLDYAQALYEKKLLTYPRTDSNYLTEDMRDTLPGLCEAAISALPFPVTVSGVDAARVTDNAKVNDHHALLPTNQMAGVDLSALPAGERNLLTLVTIRLLCAVGEKQVYEDTEAEITCGGGLFTAKGRVIVSPGFTEVEQAFLSTLKKKPESDSKEEPGALPPLSQGQTFEKMKATAKEGTTSPPRHFTEDLLLSAMEHAGAKEFAQIGDVERTGLGTPATRAGVLEKLVRGGFLERKGRQLLPTKKGTDLIAVLPDTVKSASLTAQWESGLKDVERGEQSAAAFMEGIEGMVSDLVAQYRGVSVDTSMFRSREVIGACPRCGSDVVEGKKNFYCTSRECPFSMWKDDRFFTSKHKELTKPMAAALLKNGRIKVKGLFSEKKGVLYDAFVVLADTGGKYVNYKIELPPRPKNTQGKE
ncbi:DNA topoisomerase 3 [Otoolea muris]|uniref:DNA topoisomerase 3 n=1 Tax=Otoolea muris TaxID=2941515 RepID=UPI0020407EC1|nr:DNA topoisomerase 3 [Otoolea muris]